MTPTPERLGHIRSSTSISGEPELEAEVSKLQRLVKSLNTWYLRAAGVAAIIGILAFWLQYFASKKAEELSEKQSALLSLKDEKLSTDLRDKDVEIGNARAVAAYADERAGDANNAAGHANERASKLEHDNLRLRERLVEMGPRDLLLSGQRKNELIKALKPFRGQVVLLISGGLARMGRPSVADQEIEDVIRALAVVVDKAGWVRRGVSAGGWLKSGIWISASPDASDKCKEAARVFREGLKRIGVRNDEMPGSALREIGMKQEEIVVAVLANPARPVDSAPDFIIPAPEVR